QAEDGIRDFHVTGVQTCALPISSTIFLIASVFCFASSNSTVAVFVSKSTSALLMPSIFANFPSITFAQPTAQAIPSTWKVAFCITPLIPSLATLSSTTFVVSVTVLVVVVSSCLLEFCLQLTKSVAAKNNIDIPFNVFIFRLFSTLQRYLLISILVTHLLKFNR